MPDTSIPSQLYRRYEERAVARILNDQALHRSRAVAYIDRGTAVIDEEHLKAALYETYVEVMRELRGMIRFDNRMRNPGAD